ncbi:hypothetical protein [Pontibacter pamirensis]|uniref:hypothetical protein n=1 Tax=Pontibacter pamirensis TaxID=2562824 RepID=UPI00138A687A|nr:hypothetical protein [Pontibacter pamirensis]
MKNTLLILIFLAVVTGSSAQSMGVTDDGLDKVVLAVDLDGLAMANLEMKRELKLTEDQYNKVARVNELRFTKMVEAEHTYAANDILRSNSVRKIHIQCDQTLKDVLDEQQMRQFLELEGRFHMQLMSENE